MTDTSKKVFAWIGGSIIGGGVALTVVAMAMDWWIAQHVGGQLKDAGIVPESQVTALETRIENLEKIHEKDTVRVETKAEAIARILMEDGQ